MSDKKGMPKALQIVLAGATVLAVYIFAIRPRILRWGATDEEASRPLPGDELISQPKMEHTLAITIHAPAEQVWPWLVQIGHKRAGWYSYDWLHRLMTIAGSVDDERCSADRVIPELQQLQLGDTIEIAPDMGYQVATLEPNDAMVLFTNLDASTMQGFDPAGPSPAKYLISSWAWILDELDEQRTRLIVRIRQDYDPSLVNALLMHGIIEPGSFVMQERTLRGIRQRAGKSYPLHV